MYWRSCYFFFFFFSSRRRHTRLQGDWSSDVCSSDLRVRWARSVIASAGLRQFSPHSGAAATLPPTLPLLLRHRRYLRFRQDGFEGFRFPPQVLRSVRVIHVVCGLAFSLLLSGSPSECAAVRRNLLAIRPRSRRPGRGRPRHRG